MKPIKIALYCLLFVGGMAVGFFIKNYPIIQFNKELKIYEVFNLLLTATIALLIPFFIKRWIEDNRHVKNNLIDEMKDSLKETERIMDKIIFCHNRKAISPADKDEINQMFERSDNKLYCLEQLLVNSYDTETKVLRTELKEDYMAYWKCATGSELMSSTFNVISEDYYRRHNLAFLKFEVRIKKAINKVHRL